MIYVTSDIHGCYNQYLRLLQRLDLKEDDRLYILGNLVEAYDLYRQPGERENNGRKAPRFYPL